MVLISKLNDLKHYLFLLLLISVSCQRHQFKWRNKIRNTRLQLEVMDSTLYLNDVSTNNKYGFSPYHPVKLGITNLDLASTYPDMYFNAMTGPKGETLNYKRVKSCCPFKTINSPKNYENVAVIEVYEINYTGLDKPIPVYVNFFDQGKVMALKGFKIKNLKK